jgi:hypothetical protein
MPLPAVVETSLVVVVELRPGVRVAASWTGRGRYVTLHAQAGTGQAIALDSWWVWDDARDCPAIEATLPALESFVMERLAEAGGDELLADLAEEVGAWDGCDEIVPVSVN